MGSSAERQSSGPRAVTAEADRGRLRALAGSLRTPLYANAYALLANQVSAAALGFLYWLLAARLYPVEVVGGSSAVISLLLLVAGIAQLGLGSAMVRFMPRAGRHARRLALIAYAAVVTAASVAGLTLLVLDRIPALGQKLSLGGLPPAALVVATTLWAVFYFQDGLLNGLGHSGWVLVENLLYNLAKIGLLVLGVAVLGSAGIVESWFLPTPFAILLVAWLVFSRFIGAKDSTAEETSNLRPLSTREVVTSVTWDHLGSMVSEASVRLLPLLVVAILGTAANAYFYQSWLVATTLSLAASGMSHSFTMQAASDPDRIGAYSRGILRHMFLMIGPVAVTVGAAAPLILSLFGSRYVAAAPLLRWLMFATPLVVFNTWYLAYVRVVGRMRRVTTLQAVGAGLLLVLGALGLGRYGIVGIGAAWLVSQGAVAAIASLDARRVLAGGTAKAGASSGLRRLLAHADWRFLLTPATRSVAAVHDDGSTEAVGRARRPVSAEGWDATLSHDPTPQALEAAFGVLRPGGTCYTEWPAWRRGGPRALTRRLSEAGFVDVRTYWTPPQAAAGSRLWLPYPATPHYRSAVRQWVRDRTRSRIQGRLCSWAVEGAVRTGRAPTIAVVARKPGPSPRNDPLTHEWVLDRIAEFDGRSVERTLVMTGARRSSLKVHMLVFDGPEPRLRWVVKAPRYAADIERVRAERDILTRLAARPDRPHGIVVPELAFFSEEPGFPVMIESALVGRPLDRTAHLEPYPELAVRLAEALAEFGGERPRTARRVWWDDRVEPWLGVLESRLAAAGDVTLAGAARDVVSGLGALPLVWAHNDCAPWNVVMMGDRFGLFDWEDGWERWLPGLDLVYCLATTAFSIDGVVDDPHAVRSYRRLLDPRAERGAGFAEATSGYAAALGISDDDMARLRVATWAFASSADPAVRAAAEGHDRSTLGRSVCLMLLRTELERLAVVPPGTG